MQTCVDGIIHASIDEMLHCVVDATSRNKWDEGGGQINGRWGFETPCHNFGVKGNR